jgi:hypothetical protein
MSETKLDGVKVFLDTFIVICAESINRKLHGLYPPESGVYTVDREAAMMQQLDRVQVYLMDLGHNLKPSCLNFN